MNPIQIAYIQGRPGAHPTHAQFAETVDAKFHYVDFKMRWQDKNKSILFRITSWFVCAFTFPAKKNYNIFLVDNLHFMPVLMKSLGLLKKEQKIVAHMGSHTLYFIYAHKFSKTTEYAHIWALKRYDALVCEGKMAEMLVRKILGENTPKIYTVINGIPAKHFPVQTQSLSTPKSKNILFIGHGTGRERMWYKGLDLMISAFALAKQIDPELTFTIVGEWENDIKTELTKTFGKEIQESIFFEDETPELEKHFAKSSLYLHCARGEAFGLSIIAALAHGIPAIISEWTGAKEVVEKINKDLIVPLDETKIAEKILWFFNLNVSIQKELSEISKTISLEYTSEKANDYFKDKFTLLQKDFGFIK